MAISAAQVKELREATGLGMMACKKALTEAEGDMQKAMDNLRKQGQATAAKRAGKAAKEGKVSIKIKNNAVSICEVNAETDFVARNEDFAQFVEDISDLLIAHKPEDVEAAKKLTSEAFGGQTVEAKTLELVGKIGENIAMRRCKILTVDPESEGIFSYVHGNDKIGVVTVLTVGDKSALSSDALAQLGKDLSMQIAASNPVSVDQSGVPEEIVSKERDIYMTQAQNSGKPEKIWDRIVEGKLAKFYKEIVLMDQAFVKDPDQSVTDRIKTTEKELGTTIAIRTFVRYEVGSEE